MSDVYSASPLACAAEGRVKGIASAAGPARGGRSGGPVRLRSGRVAAALGAGAVRWVRLTLGTTGQVRSAGGVCAEAHAEVGTEPGCTVQHHQGFAEPWRPIGHRAPAAWRGPSRWARRPARWPCPAARSPGGSARSPARPCAAQPAAPPAPGRLPRSCPAGTTLLKPEAQLASYLTPCM